MSDRWKRMEAMLESRRGMRRALDTGGFPAVTALNALPKPAVHKPEETVWTEDGNGDVRCFHVEADGGLHETAESRQWVKERGRVS